MTVAPDPLPRQVSDTFDPRLWREVEAAEHGGPELTDITYHRAVERVDSPDGERTVRDLPTVRIAFDRPQVRNAFRPHTVDELYREIGRASCRESREGAGWASCFSMLLTCEFD